MTYFVKVTRLNSTDCTIKSTVNVEMTHHINKLYVIMSYFSVAEGKQNLKKTIHNVDSSIKMHENYAINKPRAVSSIENPGRVNGEKTHCSAVSARNNTRRPGMAGDR